MSAITHPIERHVAQVRYRLILQVFLGWLTWTWAIGLAVAVLWIFIEPYILGANGLTYRWWVGAGALLAATCAAVLLTRRDAPDHIAAALALDERFGLAERVTTALQLRDDQRASSAGQALLSDTTERLASIRVSERFPIRMDWRTALVPALGLLFCGTALMYEPFQASAIASSDATALTPASPEVEQKSQELLKQVQERRKRPAEERSERLENIDAELERILRRPRDTQEQARERVKEMTALEEAMKKAVREETEKIQAVKNQLAQLDRMERKPPDAAKAEQLPPPDAPTRAAEEALAQGDTKKAEEEIEQLKKKAAGDDVSPEEKSDLDKQIGEVEEKLAKKKKEEAAQDGPAKDLQEALADGDLKKAKEEVEKLKRQSQSGQMSAEDKEKLQKQLQDLSEKLDRLAKNQDKKDELKRKQDEGKLDAETAEQERKQLEKDTEQLKDLDDLAKKMQKCKQCAQKGSPEDLAQALEEAGEQLGKMSQKEDQRDEIEESLQRLQSARDSLDESQDKSSKSKESGKESGEDDAETLSRGDKSKSSQGSQNDGSRKDNPSKGSSKNNQGGGVGSGQRPEKESQTGEKDEKQKGRFSPKGQKVFDGSAPGKAINKKSSVEITGDIKQAAQEAPAAIDNQRIPRQARDMAKGYFRNLGQQGDK